MVDNNISELEEFIKTYGTVGDVLSRAYCYMEKEDYKDFLNDLKKDIGL